MLGFNNEGKVVKMNRRHAISFCITTISSIFALSYSKIAHSRSVTTKEPVHTIENSAFKTAQLPSPDSYVTLKISIQNLGPNGGSLVTPLWFGFHDGSFRTIIPGRRASTGIEHAAEDGVPGPGLIIEEVINDAVTKGIPLNNLSPYREYLMNIFGQIAGRKTIPVQGLLYPDPISPNGLGFFPGEGNSTIRRFNGNFTNYRFFSFAAMVFPSNDAFISNEKPIEIFDSRGNFIGADFIVYGSQVWDAGTEINDESTSNVPFSLNVYGQGIPENGVVTIHPGLKPKGSGGVLDVTSIFANANFKTPGYQVARIIISKM